MLLQLLQLIVTVVCCVVLPFAYRPVTSDTAHSPSMVVPLSTLVPSKQQRHQQQQVRLRASGRTGGSMRMVRWDLLLSLQHLGSPSSGDHGVMRGGPLLQAVLTVHHHQ